MREVEYRAVWVEKPAQNSLAHHGIKGMKWGVRRTPEQLGNDIPSAGGGGGGFIDEDEMDEKEKELIKDLGEGDLDGPSDIRNLVAGKPVIKTNYQKMPDGTVRIRTATFQRKGNDLNAQYKFESYDPKTKKRQLIHDPDPRKKGNYLPAVRGDTHKNVFAKDPDKAGDYAERRIVAQQSKEYARKKYSASKQQQTVQRLKREKQNKEELRKRPQQWT